MTTDETKQAGSGGQQPPASPEGTPDGAARPSPGQHLVRVLRSRAVVARQIDLAKVRIGGGAKVLQSSALPVAAQTSALVKRRTSEVAIRLARFNKHSAGPSLSRSFHWLGRRLHPASLIRDYRKFLSLVHATFIGREEEAIFFVSTRGHVRLVRLSIPSQVRRSGRDYRPTPYKVFDWAMSVLPEDLGGTAFVDYGAGRGRALLLASHHGFEKIIGAEIAQELHDDCQMNIAQYPRSRMKCRDVECIHTRATTLPTPDQPAVFYFFNPFDAGVFEKVLARIARSYKRSRREMHLICVDMREAGAVEAQGMFHRVPFPLATRAKIKAFSPYSIRVYKTDP